MNSLKEKLIQKSIKEGFDICRICSPDAIPDAPKKLTNFLKNDYHGQMNWLYSRQSWRSNPKILWPKAQSIIMLAHRYTPEIDPLKLLTHKDKGSISVYARNRDYHDIIKKRLKSIGRWLINEVVGSEIKVFVDTAPVMEKPLGQAAGIGWQGKHTNLVSREIGNWFFLGSIFTTVTLPNDLPETDHCGSCSSCLDICPTNAFPAPYQLDARRCISYLTIEHDGPIDIEYRSLIGNRIYGCDDCLAVCPWNKFAKTANEMGYLPRDELIEPELKQLVKLSEKEFRSFFSKSPIKRIGRDRFIRNVIYAIGNSNDPSLIPYLESYLTDTNYVLMDAAKWAVERLNKL